MANCTLCRRPHAPADLHPLDSGLVCAHCLAEEEERYHRLVQRWEGAPDGPYCDHDMPADRCRACHQ